VSEHLIELARSKLVVEQKLQEELDKLVPPTTTGYLHREESWTIVWAREGEHGVDIEIAIDPPEGAYSWNATTIEKLQTLQTQLGCDRIYVFARESGRIRYIAAWDKR
jgi:hypothetical protein